MKSCYGVESHEHPPTELSSNVEKDSCYAPVAVHHMNTLTHRAVAMAIMSIVAKKIICCGAHLLFAQGFILFAEYVYQLMLLIIFLAQ